MATISQEKFGELFRKMPSGVQPGALANALQKRGHTVEAIPPELTERERSDVLGIREDGTGFERFTEGASSLVGGVRELGEGLGRTIFSKTPGFLLPESIEEEREAFNAIEKDLKSGITPEVKRIIAEGDEEQVRNIRDIFAGDRQIQNQIERTRTAGLTAKQIAGSAAQTLLTVTLPGVKALNGPLSVAKVGASAGAGAAFGATGGLRRDEDFEEIMVSTAAGGLSGAAIPFAEAGIKAAARTLVHRMPKSMMERVVRRTPTQKLRGKHDPAQYLLDKKSVGTTDNLIKANREALKTLDDQISTELKKTAGKHPKVSLDVLYKETATKLNKQGWNLNPNEVKSIVEKTVPQKASLLQQKSLPLDKLNDLRVGVDKVLGDKAFQIGGPELGANRQIVRAFANNSRNTVQSGATQTKQMFFDYSKELALKEALARKAAVEGGRSVFRFSDMISGGGGYALGGAPGVIIGVGLQRAINSSVVQSGTAVALNSLKALTPILTKLHPIEQIMLFNLIDDIDIDFGLDVPVSDV